MTYFYGRLFAAEPEISAMFPAAMDGQRQSFYRALYRIAVTKDDGLDDYLAELGRAHRKFGVRTEHYAAFRTALLAAAYRFAPPGGEAEQADAEDSWLAAFDHAAEVMARAAEDDATGSPAWWTAEVTSHEPRTPQVAVLTLQPDQPFPYLPGQHLSVQTPRWPRLWRRYSIANAPREDGSLTLHVRAVDGGLVSTTLVHHLEPGDTLLLGPAEGRMTADTESRRPVLCLAGGTGLAPLKAIAEAIGRATGPDTRRDIVLYHGARTEAGLYDLPALRRMELDYPWLEFVPATSDERAAGVAHGAIPVLGAKADWEDRDIYISGPDDMIVAAAGALRTLGADPALLHYDLPAENEERLRSQPRTFGINALHLPPARDPCAVGDLVVAEERGRLGVHDLRDLAEDQADFLFRARVRAHFDGVPQRPDVRGPHQPGGDAVRRETPHERGLVLLLVEGHAVVVEPEVAGHPLLEGLHLAEQGGGALHELGVLLRPVGEPEGQLVEPDEAQRLLRDGRSRAMPNELMGQDATYVVQHEGEVEVLENGAMAAAQAVLQVLGLVVANAADVRIEARLPGAVTDLTGELGEVLRVAAELVPVEPLQPALSADLAQVGGERLIIELGTRDQEDLGFNVPHTRHPTWAGEKIGGMKQRGAAWRVSVI